MAVEARNLITDAILWSQSIGGDPNNKNTVTATSVLFSWGGVNADNPALISYDKADGTPIFAFHTDRPPNGPGISAIEDDDSGEQDTRGTIWVGSLRRNAWFTTADGDASGVHTDSGFGSAMLWELDATTGSVVNSIDFNDQDVRLVHDIARLSSGDLIVVISRGSSTGRDHMVRVNLSGDIIWEVSGGFSDIALSNGSKILASHASTSGLNTLSGLVEVRPDGRRLNIIGSCWSADGDLEWMFVDDSSGGRGWIVKVVGSDAFFGTSQMLAYPCQDSSMQGNLFKVPVNGQSEIAEASGSFDSTHNQSNIQKINILDSSNNALQSNTKILVGLQIGGVPNCSGDGTVLLNAQTLVPEMGGPDFGILQATTLTSGGNPISFAAGSIGNSVQVSSDNLNGCFNGGYVIECVAPPEPEPEPTPEPEPEPEPEPTPEPEPDPEPTPDDEPEPEVPVVVTPDGTTIDADVAFPLTFNVVQQGVNDQFALPLSEQNEGVYTGSFKIEKSDGVFNKDGLAAIIVNIPNPCTQLQDVPCGQDSLDNLNRLDLSVLRDFNISYEQHVDDISPEAVLEEYKASRAVPTTNVTSMSQLYDKDDPRFVFGNPKFFIRKV